MGFLLGLGLSLILGVIRSDLRGLRGANLGFGLGLSPWNVWISLGSFLGLGYLTHCNWYIYRFCNTIDKGMKIELFLLKS